MNIEYTYTKQIREHWILHLEVKQAQCTSVTWNKQLTSEAKRFFNDQNGCITLVTGCAKLAPGIVI